MTTYKVWNGTSWVYIDSQNYDARYILQSTKGMNSGVASLDSSGHIPSEQLPSSIVGAVSYKGTFDPTEGAPTPAAQGYYYVANGAGTISATTFATGDWLVYTDESAWDKLENSSASVTWSNVSDKPASYTPDTHDNTSHSVEYITVGGVTYEALLANDDIGTGATQVAAGNHTHSDLQPLDGDLTSIAGLSGSAGLLRKTASNTWSLDTNTYLTELSTVGNATNWDTASRPSFAGNALKVLRLNATGDAFEFATVDGTVDIHGTDSTSEFTTGDEVLIYDTSLGENRKILRGNFFNGLEGDYISIHGTFEETTPATNMELLVYDPSVPANRRMTRANFLDGISAVGTFTDLTDTPTSYEGYDETYYVRVNAASNGLEFATVPSSYTLPVATDSTLGGVKIGSGITITDGVISASALEDFASKTTSDLTLYVYGDATGDADGSSKANGFTSLQAAIDAIPDVAQNVTIIVCKGSTNYLGDTTIIQKASVKSLTIQGEYYWYANCDANAVAGKIVDADGDFTGMQVGDRVVCMHYSGTVGSSSIDDYFYATVTEIGSGYVQTSEGAKVPTTSWVYLINSTVFDGNNGSTIIVNYLTPADIMLQILGINITNNNARAIAGRQYVNRCIIYDTYGLSTTGYGVFVNSAIFIPASQPGLFFYGNSQWYTYSSIVSGLSTTGTAGLKAMDFGSIFLSFSGIFSVYCACLGDLSTTNIHIRSTYISPTCTYGAYGYNITLSNCTNNAATPVYNLTSGGSIEEWDGQALPSIDDATGGQVLALKSDKSALEFVTVDLDTLSAEPKSNLIINGDFSVAQRGTSFTSATWRTNADDSYLLDRWLLLSDGNDIVDVTQIASPFSRSRYALQAEVETANKRFGFCQIIEANTCIPLRGQKISVSFAAKTVTDKVINNVRVAVLEWTSTADTVTSDVVSDWASDLTFATNWAALNTPANLALTTSEQTFKVENLTVGASCNNLAVFVWVDDTDCAVDDILQLGEVQVVRGSVVPEFVSSGYISDLFASLVYGRLLCATQYDRFGVAVARTTTAAAFFAALNPPMRITPAVVTPDVTKLHLNGVADVAFSSWAIDSGASSPYSLHMNITVSAGLTAGQMYNTSSTDTNPVFLEAEL